jgi:D-alanyl-D-alanine-carboxypeptidase/D-alanyl-D-alanine-endopeptidase
MKAIVPALTFLLAASSLHAQPLPSRDSLDKLVRQWVESESAVGMTIGTLSNGAWQTSSAGRIGGSGSRPPTDSTSFELGSVSKVFTGTLLADMVLRGEVSLDDPVRKFLPATVRVPSHNGREITLRDLASHVAALPREPTNYRSNDPVEQRLGYGPDDLYAFLSSLSLERSPGERYLYSNVGMALLGHVLALRAGQGYESLVTERILAPLGMHDTYIFPDSSREAREAGGFTPDMEPTPAWRAGRNSVLLGSGRWRSSIRDLHRLAQAVIDRPATPVGRALALALAPVHAVQAPNDSVGLAWHLNDQGPRIVLHSGGTGGFASFVGVEPSSRRAVVILSNTNVPDLITFGLHIIDPRVRYTPPVRRPFIAIPAAVLERYVGTYVQPSGTRWLVTREGDRLYFTPPGAPRFRLYPISELKFFEKGGREFEFVTGTDGTQELVLRLGTREFRGKLVR